MISVFRKPVHGPSALLRFVVFAALSIGFMMLDQKGERLHNLRSGLTTIFYPAQILASLPGASYTTIADFFTGTGTLRAERDRLVTEHTLLSARLQQFEAVEAENSRLRELLGSSKRVAARVLAADLLSVSLEPFTRRLLVARGSNDGVYVGQPVIDAHGIMGQITSVTPHTAIATLITDPSHAIPVLVTRSGLRAMVYGTGDPDSVKLPYLTAAADIREGDLLVSSGLDGTFPADYPVAQVTRVVNENEAFLAISAKPAARLNHSKQVLLVWTAPSARVSPRPEPKQK